MKVLFDYQVFTMQKYGGISRYFANLHYGIDPQSGWESKLGLLFSDNGYVNNQELVLGGLNEVIKKGSRRQKYNKWYGKYLVKQNSFDVFHPTFYHSYFLESIKKPFVLTVHDMIYELFPEIYGTETYKYHKEKLINRADHIIAISECTKLDIQKFYDIPDSRISVIHHGYKMQTAQATTSEIKIDGEYILFVGDRFGYKNFDFFVKAVAPLIKKHSLKLICAGGGVLNPKELQLLKELNLLNNVQQLTVNDNQLAQLYQRALAFVYPSLYEGFGLPVLEAFFNNCPVIMSNTSSLPEVGGDAAAYFDPKDEQSIIFTLENVINNNGAQNELRAKGSERLKLFGFDTCLQKTLQVYNQLT